MASTQNKINKKKSTFLAVWTQPVTFFQNGEHQTNWGIMDPSDSQQSSWASTLTKTFCCFWSCSYQENSTLPAPAARWIKRSTTILDAILNQNTWFSTCVGTVAVITYARMRSQLIDVSVYVCVFPQVSSRIKTNHSSRSSLHQL